MPNYGVGEIVTLIIIVFIIAYPPLYILSGGLQKDIRKIRKWWHDTDPDARDNHR